MCCKKKEKKITNSNSLTSLSVFISLYSGNWTLIIYNISSRKHFENTLLILPARHELIHESNIWKESLKHDGPQFHQYQTKRIITSHWTHKKKDHNVWLEIQVLAWDRHTHVAGLFFQENWYNSCFATPW